jgi:bifunctional non-homologous end joining protein LigD
VHPALRDIALMLATDFHPFSREGWIFEMKWDGYRVLSSKEQLLTRNKKDASTWYPEILAALQELSGTFVLDGEACLLDEQGLPNFEGMRARTSRKRSGQPVTYFAFDLLFLNGKDLRRFPLIERTELLRKLMRKKHPRLVYVDYIEEQGELLYRHAAANGMEGIIGKRADPPYVGERSRDWLKGKREGYHDGWERPLQRNAEFVVYSTRGKKLPFLGKRGAWWDDLGQARRFSTEGAAARAKNMSGKIATGIELFEAALARLASTRTLCEGT